MKAIAWASRATFLLAYTLVVVTLLLWLLFPAAFLRQWTPRYFQAAFPGYSLEMEELALRFPGQLELGGLELAAVRGRNGGRELLVVEQLLLRPLPGESLRARGPVLQLAGRLAGGELEARLQGGELLGQYRLEGHFSALELGGVKLLEQTLGRELRGRLGGVFSLVLNRGSEEEEALQTMDLELELVDGVVGLKQPIFGHTLLPITSLAARIEGKGRTFQLSQGVVESSLFAAEFRGRLQLQQPLGESLLSIRGTLQPRPEFLKNIEDRQTAEGLRRRLAKGPLSFTISGSLQSPGIVFSGLAELMELLQPEGGG
ncbi:type II secretion system protein GspN [Desulfogranum mediterraneum]|uniref:type II secretion system protein GspN n=1 Tax=Desulfogranum mediterraneum TaxID=160661 RepID=UPI00041C7645|nr:type II secretion system protein GspN [Desulfogranum mediterraneum]